MSPTITLANLKAALTALGSPAKARASAWFFKTGPGQYGEGDRFIGVTMPEQRRVARRFADLTLRDAERLLQAPQHEYRMTALLILVRQFRRGDEGERRQIYDLYLRNAHRINNWDLVDGSAPYIVGPWLDGHRDKLPTLRRLAKSELLWERRIAMLATFTYIKQGRSPEALAIATILRHDSHDLMHKAVGWMLREVGKHCGRAVEERFLRRHYRTLPRTALRYAIEHFPESRRRAYLAGKVSSIQN